MDSKILQDEKAPKLEDLFEKIEEIASKLEDSEVSLEDSFLLYNQGIHLLGQSNDVIEEIEKKVLILDDKQSLSQGEPDEF